METKYAAEMEEHKVRLDKEYETTRQNFMLEIEKLKRKIAQDLEKKVSTMFRVYFGTQKIINIFVCPNTYVY